MAEKKYNKLKGTKKRKRSNVKSHHASKTFEDTKKESSVSLPTDSCIDLSNCYAQRTKSVSQKRIRVKSISS